jgi:hypothetical protein
MLDLGHFAENLFCYIEPVLWYAQATFLKWLVGVLAVRGAWSPVCTAPNVTI